MAMRNLTRLAIQLYVPLSWPNSRKLLIRHSSALLTLPFPWGVKWIVEPPIGPELDESRRKA